MDHAAASDGAFDVEAFVRGLDAILARSGAPAARDFVREALDEAVRLGDRGARLTILNEQMGLLRSIGRHDEGVAAARAGVALALEMGLEGTEPHAVTLINAATSLRAAGLADEARAGYEAALRAAASALAPGDRRIAALRNNLAILLGDQGDHEGAHRELSTALASLERGTDAVPDPATDPDVATTLVNLSHAARALGRDAEADSHALRALAVFRAGGHGTDPHAAAALAGLGQSRLAAGDAAGAVDAYREALAIVEASYGTESDAHAVTAANLADAEAALARRDGRATASSPAPASPSAPRPDLTGLELSHAYWDAHGPELLARFSALRGRVAAGLVGHGSECYGFDDAVSRDHDFGPGFCLWLTADDHAAWGAQLQEAYDALPAGFLGYGPRLATERASGAGRRVGVFEIGAFFEGITGHPAAPGADRPHEWLALEEATLAAATNGAVFADPRGAFSGVRNGFRRMPADVRLALIGRRLAMASQSGQYNVPRMLSRGDGEGAWLAAAEFVNAAASLVFLLGGPTAVGYLPYYKWRFAALRDLASRPGARLPEVPSLLADVTRDASAACVGADPGARESLSAAIERTCALIAAELRAQGLSASTDTFLEHQRAHVQARIADDWLRAL